MRRLMRIIAAASVGFVAAVVVSLLVGPSFIVTFAVGFVVSFLVARIL